MSLDAAIRDRLNLPAVCAPMFLVSGPRLVAAACKAGTIGVLPRHNVRTLEQFDQWLAEINAELDAFRAARPDARIGPVAVNIDPRVAAEDLRALLDLCRRRDVQLFVTAVGDPSAVVAGVHDRGGRVFHDVTTLRHAERAIGAGVDGVICIGAGGGGHSGTISHLALVPRVRAIFDGTIVMAGGVSTGAAIRAAEILGADLAYLGTRFIATEESLASAGYKRMLLEHGLSSLRYTGAVAGTPANWLAPSLAQHGIDLDGLIEGGSPLPRGEVRPWRDIWSAGQGIELIDDVPTVGELVRRLRSEYVEACALPSMAAAAALPHGCDRSGFEPSRHPDLIECP